MRELPPRFYLVAPLIGALLWLAEAWLSGEAHDSASMQSEFLRGLVTLGGMFLIMFIFEKVRRNA